MRILLSSSVIRIDAGFMIDLLLFGSVGLPDQVRSLQRETEPASLTFATVHGNVAAVRFDDLLCDG